MGGFFIAVQNLHVTLRIHELSWLLVCLILQHLVYCSNYESILTTCLFFQVNFFAEKPLGTDVPAPAFGGSSSLGLSWAKVNDEFVLKASHGNVYMKTEKLQDGTVALQMFDSKDLDRVLPNVAVASTC